MYSYLKRNIKINIVFVVFEIGIYEILYWSFGYCVIEIYIYCWYKQF